MAFLFVVGVYGLVGLGLLWLIEGLTAKKWRLFAWLPQAGKQVDSEATERDSELTERERDREPSRIAAREHAECLDTHRRWSGLKPRND